MKTIGRFIVHIEGKKIVTQNVSNESKKWFRLKKRARNCSVIFMETNLKTQKWRRVKRDKASNTLNALKE